jgi:hypothetical protein
VDLRGRPGWGRTRSKVRRQYRESHSRHIERSSDIIIGKWNMQRANWSRTEERHIAKFECLVHEMQSKHIDIMCLTDLHGQCDERVGLDSRFSTCMIEEFVLVQCGKVGFMMCPAVYKGWGGKHYVGMMVAAWPQLTLFSMDAVSASGRCTCQFSKVRTVSSPAKHVYPPSRPLRRRHQQDSV